jgi:signal transduction histidine kinase/ligand-binding sensor domain-containing protein/DNA-binding response OmpR family regulator
MRYFYIVFLLLVFGCGSKEKNILYEQLEFHPGPRIVALNTHEGYSVNPFTGDSIRPIITSSGESVITGVPVPARGRVIDPNSVDMPVIVPAGKPTMVPAHLNLDNIPGAFPRVPLDIKSLSKIPAKLDPIFTQEKRMEADTSSLIKLRRALGRPVPSRQPEPVKALPPLMKDNARSNIKYLDVEHGLSSTNLIALLEDSGGHIWIATQQKGISMYDGETFTHFTEKEGLWSNYVTSIMEDKQGNLWFGTQGGISIYDGCSFDHIPLKEDSLNVVVWSMLEDSSGHVWFGTDKGLFVYKGDSLMHLTERDGLINNHIWSVVEGKDGLIWVGTIGGVSLYNGRTFSHLTQNEGLTSNRIWCLLKDRQGRIWMGTDVGVNMYDGDSIIHITEKDGLIHNVVRTIREDSQGNIWFGTLKGVSKFDGGSLMHITEDEGLNSHRIRDVMEDSQGNIWFATEDGGISIYYGKTFTYFSREDGFRELGMLSFLQDKNNNYWFGAWGSGVSMYDGQYFRHFTQAEGLIQNAVFCILEDRLGNLWFGTFDGLCKYDGNAFTHFKKSQGLSGDIIRALLEDRNGNLWIGTSGAGLTRYDGEVFTYYSENEGLVDNRVRAILEDHLGNLWVGTLNGVSMYNGEAFVHYTEKEGLGNQSVSCMLEDSRGNIWFGTDGGGAYMFNGSSYIGFTQLEGLSNNYVTSLVEDYKGHIWITTKHGLNRVTFDTENLEVSGTGEFDPKPLVHVYNLMDGLKSAEFIASGALVDKQHRIWWGSPKGVVVLDPDHIEKHDAVPVIQLTRVDINGQFVDYRQEEMQGKSKLYFTGVNRFHNYPLDLELPFTHNRLTFYFTANDWFASQNLRYAYKMEGLDEQWNSPATDAMADYRNMPPGQYTFQVKAIGAAEKWSEAFEYSFRILPPPWFKWWALVIYASMLILLIRWYRGFLIRREKIKTNLKIKEAEVKKMQELDLMKSRFFANISHEFRTPLTLIQGPLEEMRNKIPMKEERTIHLFQVVKRNVKRLQELINQLLDISKLETGNVSLQVASGNLIEYIKTIILSFLSLAEHNEVQYAYVLPEDEGMGFFDSDKLEKILINLISNAFKYTPSGGSIRVFVRFMDISGDPMHDKVEIRVEDTGKGIPGEQLSKIFDRFYQVQDSDSTKTEGTGLGLALVKELVDLYRGNIQVESETGQGSTFVVTLPVSAEHFRHEEIIADHAETAEKKGSLETAYAYKSSTDGEFPELSFPTGAKANPLILIVEDNDDLREYITRILGDSYRFIAASNGKVGLDRAREYIPDLVISDVMMPDMDGIEMCKRLKIDERTDHIPIVILTARADRSSKLEGLETGADDYLIKPFDSEELEVRVKNLLEQRRRLRDKFRMEFLRSEPELRLPSDQLFLNRLIDIFKQHYSDPDFKIPQLSGKLNLSQSQVRRKTLALSGYTPNEFLRYYRLKKAAIYFRSGHKNVAQVMYLVGFNNQSYFARCFNKLFGMTPSQFIAAQRNQPASHHA